MDIILGILESLPWYGDLLLVMGTLRMVFKPLFSIIATVVKATPSKTDDKLLVELQSSNTYAILVWAIDFFASVKIPRK